MQKLRWWSDVGPGEAFEILAPIALWELAVFPDSKVSCHVVEMVLSQDWAALANVELSYEDLSCEEAGALRRVLAFFTKRSDIAIPGVNPREVAKAKFKASELLCQETNELIKLRRRGLFAFSPRVERVLAGASRKISAVLFDGGGEIPSLGDLKLKFGPGATTSIPKRMASPREKLGSPLACSVELFPLAASLLREVPGWASLHTGEVNSPTPHITPRVEVHRGKVQFVPKSWKEERAIVVEPILNTLVQGGLGSWLARRLRKAGVDIKDQTRNQRSARAGSIDGSLATIDLSSASDTIATEIVYELLPLEVAHCLSRARTGTVELDGLEIRLQKFSSMGNGFTFPLETLLFYAIAWAATSSSGGDVSTVSCYGDDIIVPTQAVELLFESLNALGFKVNRSKSFSSGPFRESCGKDYYLGTDIRPCYLRGSEGSLQGCDFFKLHNFYSARFEFEVCSHIISFIEPEDRLVGPPGYGDGHLASDCHEPRRKPNQLAKGYRGYVFDTFTWTPRTSFKASRGDWVLPQYTVYCREGEVSESDHVRAYRRDRYDPGAHEAFSVIVPGRENVNRISIYIHNA